MTNNKLLYKQIKQELESLIVSQEMKPGERIPTEFELAEKYQVSRITVIRAVKELELLGLVSRTKGKGTFINEPREWKINMKSEASPSIRVLSLVLPYDEHFGYQILQGVERKAMENGYYVTFHNSEQSVEKEREILLKLIEDGVEGILVYPVHSDNNLDIFSKLLITKQPFVVLDRSLDGLQVPHVMPDHFRGTYDMVQHLFELGHRKIAFVSLAKTEAMSVLERFKGYCQAHVDAKISLETDYVVEMIKFSPDGYSIDDNVVKKVLHYLLELPQPPTAIVGVNDKTAIMLIRNAEELGIKIPQHISVTGFDNILIGKHVEIPLTTVEQSFADLGEKAAEMILEQIKQGVSPTQKIVLPTKLIIRESTASPAVVSEHTS